MALKTVADSGLSWVQLWDLKTVADSGLSWAHVWVEELGFW